jgi:transcriptional regulator with XRE-family HTH domain
MNNVVRQVALGRKFAYNIDMDIRTWRLAEDLSMEEAAKRCGVAVRSWPKWEYGFVRPGIDIAHSIIKGSKGKVTLAGMVAFYEQVGGKLRKGA